MNLKKKKKVNTKK